MENRQDPNPAVKQAICAYAQAEKVKSGLIWICRIADQVAVVDGPGRQPALDLLTTLVHMVADESHLAGSVTGDPRWHEVGKKVKTALVMIRSGVPQETGFHLTQALVQVTGMAGRAAAVLEENGLF